MRVLTRRPRFGVLLALTLVTLILTVSVFAQLLSPVQGIRVLVLFKDDSGDWFQDQSPPETTACPGAARTETDLKIHIVHNETVFYTRSHASCSEVFSIGNATYTVYTSLNSKMHDLNLQEDTALFINPQGNIYSINARLLADDFCGDRVCIQGETCMIDCQTPGTPTCGNRVCEVGEYCGNCTDCSCPIDQYCQDNVTCVSWEDVSVCGNGECEPGETPSKCSPDCDTSIAYLSREWTADETAIVRNLRKSGFSVSTLDTFPTTLKEFSGIVFGMNPINGTETLVSELNDFTENGGGSIFIGEGPYALNYPEGGARFNGSASNILGAEKFSNASSTRIRFDDATPFGTGTLQNVASRFCLKELLNDSSNTSIIAHWSTAGGGESDTAIFALNRTVGSGRTLYWGSVMEGEDDDGALLTGFLQATKYTINASFTHHTTDTGGSVCGDSACSDYEAENSACCEDCGCPYGSNCIDGTCKAACSITTSLMADTILGLGNTRKNLLQAAIKAGAVPEIDETIIDRITELSENVTLASREIAAFDFTDCDAFRNTISKRLKDLKTETTSLRNLLRGLRT